MKILFVILVAMALFAGCEKVETFEIITDVPAMELCAPSEIKVNLPVSACEMKTDAPNGETIYFCGDYVIVVQTMNGGDIDRTIRQMTGFGPKDLTVLHTVNNELPRYEFAWSATGEEDCQICRGVILDDGKYHYAVTAMADYDRAGAFAEQWKEILSSVSVSID